MTSDKLNQPEVVLADPGIIQEPERIKLDNNVNIFCFNAGEEDIVQIDFSFDAGYIYSQNQIVALVTNSMLFEGTVDHTAQELNEILDYYGITCSPYCSADKAGIVFVCLNKYLEKMLELAHEMIYSPSFSRNELDILINKQRNDYLISKEMVSHLAREAFKKNIFGANHPYGKSIEWSDFDIVNPDELKLFHSIYYHPDNLYITVAGKLRKDITTLLNNYFGEALPNSKSIKTELPEITAPSTLRVHVQKDNAVQTAIRIGGITIQKTDPNYTGIKIVNTILGGYFGSRLMKNLREDKGYTYGIGSSVFSLQQTGMISINTEVNRDNTNSAIDEIIKEIDLLSTENVSTEELDIVKRYMLGNIVRSLDGPFALASSFKLLWEYGLDNSFNYKMVAKIKNIKCDEIKELAGTYYNTANFSIITAGDN